MPHTEYPDIESAEARSAEMWDEVKREGWQEGNVTTRLYGTRQRTGDPESDEGLPETGDAFIVVPDNALRLDGLVIAEFLTLDEYAAIIEVYPEWSGDGVAYYDGDEPGRDQPSLVRRNGQLWRCIQGHPSQVDRVPGVAISLWALAAPTGVIPEWIQPTGGHDVYGLGALVTHVGWVWQSEHPANSWEPGSVGAENLWTQLEEL